MSEQEKKQFESANVQALNQAPPVGEIQGKDSRGHDQVKSEIAGSTGPKMKVYHIQKDHNCEQGPVM